MSEVDIGYGKKEAEGQQQEETPRRFPVPQKQTSHKAEDNV
ncbi:MAG: hypothetical protein PVH03_03225 [Chloroflexota bacterium]